ncbi:hypothetical protein Tco_1009841, partial [Tanacetum coccineum]
MLNPKFAETHNLVAFLEKPKESDGFKGMIDFLNASSIRYALTIQALVDKKKVIITETSIRSDLKLKDAEGTYCLPTATIFSKLERMSAKTTVWNEFSSTMASAIICLATNQKFNFSKYIFDNMVKNSEGEVKFLMYPRRKQRKDSDPTKPIPDEATNKEHVSTPSYDPSQSDYSSKEIASLKKRVKQLEKRKKSRTSRLKRLRMVSSASRVESSNDVSLGAQEDASKQGRKIANLDVNAEVTLIDKTQERNDEEMLFDVQDDLQGEEVVAKKEVAKKEVSAADPVTTASEVVTTANIEVTTASAPTTTIDELTLSQTLIEIKATKPKAVTTAATTTTTTRPKAKG